MTIVEKLYFKGFKSFAKPTEVEFGPDFSIIIGPNGSGKTNIIDAFTFVLGKSSAKSMRAEKSSSLIYNGGKKGSPSREAEVTIYFSNKEKEFPVATDSIKITRVVRQSGNSIYKINEVPHTRQQVVDVLRKAKIDPDGHNIVLQGDITSFATMKPEDRKIIVEDISGISLYEDKKQKAMLELNKVDEKLNEANLILKERSVYLRELKKERDQALKYKEVESKIKQNKATFLSLQIKEKQSKKDEIESKIEKYNDSVESITKKIKELQEAKSSSLQTIEEITKSIEEKGEVEQVSLQKNLEVLKESILKKTTRADNLNVEISRITQRITQLDQDREDIQKKIQFLNEQKLKLESSGLRSQELKIKKQIDNFKQHHNLSDFSSIEKLESQIEQSQNNIFKLQNERNHIGNLIASKNARLEEIDKSLDQHLSPENKKNIQSLEKIKKDLDKLVNKLNVTISQVELTHENIHKKKLDMANLEATRIRITESIQENQAVATVMNSNLSGVYGTIASLGKVDPKYSKALEIAAGARVNSVIVDSDLTAQKCISLLKEKKAGTAIFLPLNKLKQRVMQKELEQLKNFSGVRDIAINLIRFDKRYDKAFSYIFGSTLVVDDIPTARKVGIGRARMVTLEGDLTETSGAMIGGYRRKTAGVFEQKDIDSQIVSAEKELELLSSNLSELQSLKVSENSQIENLKNQKIDLEAKLAKLKIDNLPELKESRYELQRENQEHNNQLKNIEKQVAESQKQLEKLKQSRKPSTSNASIQKILEDLEKQQLEIHGKIIQSSTEIRDIEDRISTIHNPELNKIHEIIKQHNKEIEEFKKELNSLESELKSQKPVLIEEEKKEQRFREDYKALFNKRNKIQEEIRNAESKISQEDFKAREIEKKVNEISLVRAKVVAELEALQAEFEPYIGTQLRRNISREDLKLEIIEAEKVIKNFGNINMKALEVYETVEREHEELVKKANSLNEEKESVLSMMTEIEGKKKRTFMKTYRQIAENFKRIFLQLSTKGDAYLDLEDKENPLNGGVNIKVRLAGTKFLDLNSLSGGEKTLTALAFIFAIQEYEPASFYLLDEVDAALDKTNSQLLSKLIGNYSKSSQYIVISHNDSIITEASRIYGVSMQQNGISKIISLKL